MKAAVLVFAVHCVSLVHSMNLRKGVAPAPAPAPAGLPSMPVLHVKFELNGFNYWTMSQVACPKQGSTASGKSQEPKEKVSEELKPDPESPESGPFTGELPGPFDGFGTSDGEIDGEGEGEVEPMEGSLLQRGRLHPSQCNIPFKKYTDEELEKKAGRKIKTYFPKGEKDPEAPSVEAYVEEGACPHVSDVLEAAVKAAIHGVMECLHLHSLAPAPAPVAAPAFFSPAPAFMEPLPRQTAGALVHVQHRVSAAQALPSSPAPVAPDATTIVRFHPGHFTTSEQKPDSPKSTIVEVAVTNIPGNDIDDVANAKPFLKEGIESGLLGLSISQGLEHVLEHHDWHGEPTSAGAIGPIKLKVKVIKQWDVQKCKKHVKSLVDQFSVHYTREQVPMALYNECTNFITKLSFSHDHYLDPLDTKKCHESTIKFANRWKYGKNAKEDDFTLMCNNFCEKVHGHNAPKCNISEGDKMLNQQPGLPA